MHASVIPGWMSLTRFALCLAVFLAVSILEVVVAAPDVASTRGVEGTQARSDDWHLHGVSSRSAASTGREAILLSTCVGGRYPNAPCSSNADCPGRCNGGKVPGEDCFGNGGLNCRGACSFDHSVRCAVPDDCAIFLGGKCTAPTPGTCNGPVPGTCNCDDGNPCTDDVNDAVQGCVFTPNSAPCNDGSNCTTNDTCSGGQCTGSPVQCFGDGDPCTAEYCDNVTGCQSVPVTQMEVSGARFTNPTTLTWTYTFPVSSYNVYRGTIPAATFGSRLPSPPVYDQTCFERDDAQSNGLTVSSDAAAPAAGTAFYYLVVVRQSNCGEGPVGTDSSGTPVPNSSPCPP